MSRENVELLLRLQPDRHVDLVRLFCDEHRWAAFTDTAAPFYHADFQSVTTVLGTGMDGFRALWRDWLAPWATYRTEVERAVDLGERVLVLNRSFGRLEGSTQEVGEAPAGVWTVRDGKIARGELYLDRADALAAAGLAA
jgi:ketosteroid isomerase-like protein